MARHEPPPANATLVAIDIAKARNEVLIEKLGQPRRRRLTVLNTRADHDRLLELLGGIGAPVIAAFEATGNYHRPLAAYINETIRLGCDITEILEPQLRAEDMESADQEILTRLPNFIVIGARRRATV